MARLAKPLGKGRLRNADLPGKAPAEIGLAPLIRCTILSLNPLLYSMSTPAPRFRCIREGLLTAEGATLKGSLGCPVQVTTILTLGG